MGEFQAHPDPIAGLFYTIVGIVIFIFVYFLKRVMQRRHEDRDVKEEEKYDDSLATIFSSSVQNKS